MLTLKLTFHSQLPYKCCLSSTYSWEETEWVAPEDPSAAVEGTCVFPDCLNVRLS